MAKHKEGLPHVLSTHAQHGGAHLTGEPPGRRRRWILGLLAVGLAALMGGGVVVAVAASGGGGNDHGTPVADSEGSRSTSVNARDLRQCRASWRAEHRVLVAAEPTMAQWERHIGVMNQLVAGEITLDQATQFWAQTRVGAQQHYDAFAAQVRKLPRSGADPACPVPDGSAAASPALVDCSRAVAAEADTLTAARTTLTRWSRHIAAMEQLRSGMLDPTMALKMWQATWPRGVEELRVYHRAEQRSAALDCHA